MQIREMIATHPHVRGQVNDSLADCVDACFECAKVCAVCADACLGEEMVADLTQCIRLDLDCADLCVATGALAARRTGGDVTLLRPVLEACALACARCAEECERHASRHEHCRICAEVCRSCERACRAAFESLPAGGSQAH
jgi:hypothetical protein